jgi:NAD(P)-dependent dehydrogenase (short-subunit alcohol dehydrogenase family)
LSGNFDIKTVVITGSTRGLGYEMAKAFLCNGWNVVINGVNEERLKRKSISMRQLTSGDVIYVYGNTAECDYTVRLCVRMDENIDEKNT